MSLMRLHQQRIREKQLAAQANTASSINVIKPPESAGNDYQVWWAAVKMDLSRLKEFPNHDDRDRLKRDELVPKYQQYVDDWINSDSTEQNDVVAYYIVWLVDSGQINAAIFLADVAYQRGLKFQMMNRDPVTFVTDAAFIIADNEKQQTDDFLAVFQRVDECEWRINKSLQARLYKHRGIALMVDHPKQALLYLQKALVLKADIGVKGRIIELEQKTH